MFCTDFTNKENLLTWLMTFGNHAELLEPKTLRSEIKKALGELLQKYEEER